MIPESTSSRRPRAVETGDTRPGKPSWIGSFLSAYGNIGIFCSTPFKPPLYKFRTQEAALRADLEAVGEHMRSGWERYGAERLSR